jgi:hypothetical protein
MYSFVLTLTSNISRKDIKFDKNLHNAVSHSRRHECPSPSQNSLPSVSNHQPSCRNYSTKSSTIPGEFFERPIFGRQNTEGHDNIPHGSLHQGEEKMPHSYAENSCNSL